MKFETLHDVRAYLAQESIQCLICHKCFQRLTRTHLRSHGMMADDYRAEFGIPWGYSLTCPASRAISSARSLERGPMKPSPVKLGQKFPNRRAYVLAHRNYWRNEIVPMGPKFTFRGAGGRFVDTPAEC